MFNQKAIVLIPHWVQEILQRNQLPLSACLDLEKIKPIMSLNDLVSFAALQSFYKQITGADSPMNSLLWVWSQSFPTTNVEMKDFLWNKVNTLSSDASFKNEVKTRLLSADARVSQHKDAFITYDLQPQVVGVVIFPGFFVGEYGSEFQKPLVEAILKLLYVYESTHEVAKTPLFKRYLELLSVQ